MPRYLGLFWLLALCCLLGCSAAPRSGFVNYQPAAYSGPPDEKLAEKISTIIQSDFRSHVRDVNTACGSGVVTLGCTVDSAVRVQEMIHKVASIKHVREINQEGVKVDAGDFSDVEVHENVMRRINQSPGLDVARNVSVEVLDQIVRAGGTIDSMHHRNQLEKSIQQSFGTEGYNITTQIAPPIPISDEMVTINVLTELERFGRDSSLFANIRLRMLNVPITNIRVQTRDGVVTLTGYVPKLIHKLVVEDVAKGAEGPREIDNQILVHP